MATKNIEVLVGKKADQTIEQEKIGHSVAAAPQQEVGGRAHYYRWALFTCGHVCQIWYDTNNYHAYQCCYDGTVNIF